MKRKPRRQLTIAALGVIAIVALISTRPAAAEPTVDQHPFTVSVLGSYRLAVETDDGHLVRTADEFAPSWLVLALPADQTVEVVQGACEEIATATRPAGTTQVADGTELAYCSGANR